MKQSRRRIVLLTQKEMVIYRDEEVGRQLQYIHTARVFYPIEGQSAPSTTVFSARDRLQVSPTGRWALAREGRRGCGTEAPRAGPRQRDPHRELSQISKPPRACTAGGSAQSRAARELCLGRMCLEGEVRAEEPAHRSSDFSQSCLLKVYKH